MPKVSDEHLAARRRQILGAALVCFSRRGFHQTPMQAIFDEAGLSPGAVYRYFKSKEEIVQAIASETLGGFARAIEPGPDEEPLGPVELLDRFFDFIEGIELRRERLRLAIQAWGEVLHNPELSDFVRGLVDDLRTRMSATLREAQRRGALDPELDTEPAARVLIAIAQGFVVQSAWFEDLDRRTFRAAARALLSQPAELSRLRGDQRRRETS
jgi:TetR/AcrR family transcriptional regulator, transcriptional repressor of aconitase